ncbi:MAG TPA: FHA domain-containing protein [Kofleriaceae bacterium]|nr:FHA domain-containing protein [Kofleriaceae bacterium]
MSAPFGVEARCERASISSGKSTLWATVRVDPKGKALEAERAPLAVALVIDTSGSMGGDPIAHVLASCEIVATLLDARDKLAIITFSNHAGVRCGLTTCDDAGRKLIVDALRDVQVTGGTNMHAGMEAGAGVLMSAPAGLRRTMVVLSDGQPNVGISAPDQLAHYTAGLRPIGVSTLGFGLHHDEKVLQAISIAGSGRYAYVPDPMIARVDLARAALTHGGIVAESIQLELRPAEGVELLRVLPAAQLRHGGHGVRAAIGDVFVDEFRILALELALDVAPSFRGQLAEIVVEGKAPDGTTYKVPATLVVDVHAGPHTIVRDAQRDILLVRADAARAEARAHADRGATPAAVSLLRDMIKQIDASEGFVADDGTPLSEMREQLIDEAANYEKRASSAERAHQMKGSSTYMPTATPTSGRPKRADYAPGFLVGLSHDAQNRKWQLFGDTAIGRSMDNEIPIAHESLSRRHARILYMNGVFILSDLGSTNGCELNGQAVFSNAMKLKDGDIIKIGYVEFRLEVKKP